MKTLKFSFDTLAEFSAPVIEHQFVLRCCPRKGEGQRLLNCHVTLEPQTPLFEQTDGFGNTVLWGSVLDPHTRLHYRSEGTVQTDGADTAAPSPNPALRYPGQRTRPDAALTAWARALALNPADPAALGAALCGAIHTGMQYAPGTTGFATTAAQAFAQRQGVCQDFAHLFAAAARLYGLTARYCMGLTVGEGATHAWAELYYGGAWHGFDPTRGRLTDETYIRLAVGRDAADCPAESGVFQGLCSQMQTVFMRVEETAPDGTPPGA